MANKITDKQYLKLWEEFADNVRQSTAIDLNETPLQQRKRIAKLEADTEAWFAYYFPKYAYAKPAPFHIAATKRIVDNPEWYEVRNWSRELAKSTRTMMEVLFLILTGKKKYVLLISNSYDNAVRLLMPFKANLEFNQRIINDYGSQEKLGSWEAGEFKTKNGAAFRALGAGQSPRGTRNDEVRPDVLLFDDIDTDEDCRNSEQISKKWRWIEEAAIGTRSISMPTLIMFLGNIIATDCCVVRAAQFADHVDIVNIRDKNGKSSWPQKNSEEHIDRVLGQKSYVAQMKEYFNTPITEGSVFKDMQFAALPSLKEYSVLVCYTDPSFKDSKKNDYKATVLVGKWRNEFHIIKAYCEQTSTAKMIQWHYDIMELVKDNACYYYMEKVFLQDIILKEFYEAGITHNKVIPIVGDERSKPDKFTRIESLLEPLNRNGKLKLNQAELNNPHMQRLVDQFKALAPGSRAHDDAPDAVEGAVYIINNKEASAAAGNITIVARKPHSKRY